MPCCQPVKARGLCAEHLALVGGDFIEDASTSCAPCAKIQQSVTPCATGGRNHPPLHYHNKGADKVLYLPINTRLVSALKSRGWQLGDKIAEGSCVDIFDVKSKEEGKVSKVLVLEAGPEQHKDMENKIEASIRYPDVFPRVYDVFYCDVPYSTSSSFPVEDVGKRPIIVREKFDMTLAEYFKMICSTTNFWKIVEQLDVVLTKKLQLLYKQGVVYECHGMHKVGVQVDAHHSVVKIRFLNVDDIKTDTPNGEIEHQHLPTAFINKQTLLEDLAKIESEAKAM